MIYFLAQNSVLLNLTNYENINLPKLNMSTDSSTAKAVVHWPNRQWRLWGCSLVWFRILALGASGPGSNPGSPTPSLSFFCKRKKVYGLSKEKITCESASCPKKEKASGKLPKKKKGQRIFNLLKAYSTESCAQMPTDLPFGQICQLNLQLLGICQLNLQLARKRKPILRFWGE